jgi:zinc/manganese transport system substrate-binding protein
MRLTRRTALLLPLLAVPAQAQEKTLKVVASFTILADMVRQVGESRVAVHALAGPDQDLHGFEPRPSDLQAIAQADIVVINGLGLEGWATRTLQAAGFKGRTITATAGIKPRKAGHAHGHSHAGHSHSAHDPHAWQDLTLARRYVENIRAGLAAADPARAPAYTAAAARYTNDLTALDAEIRALLAPIPRNRRRAVTSHDAFAYFAHAYGIDMLAIAGTWRDAEPSARELAALAAQVKRQNIRALFLENASNPAALNALSSETGVKVGGKLYPDALTAQGGPADTYITMMRHNARTIAEALK